MHDEGPSREEFYAALGGLSKAVDAGFAQINARLDRLNGKTETHGREIAALQERSRHVHRGESRSRRDGAIGGAIAGAVMAVIEVVRYMTK